MGSSWGGESAYMDTFAPKARGRAGRHRLTCHPTKPKGSKLVVCSQESTRSGRTVKRRATRWDRGRCGSSSPPRRIGNSEKVGCTFCAPGKLLSRISKRQSVKDECRTAECEYYHLQPGVWRPRTTFVRFPPSRLVPASPRRPITGLAVGLTGQVCVKCKGSFETSAQEQAYFTSRRLKLPKRCKNCRRGGSTAAERRVKSQEADPGCAPAGRHHL